MTDIEKKALALVNEVRAERGQVVWPYVGYRKNYGIILEALCRAIEQHEAFRQEVSDAVEDYCGYVPPDSPSHSITRFIIAKPDPLVEAWIEATGNTVGMEPLNEALAKRGGKIVWETNND